VNDLAAASTRDLAADALIRFSFSARSFALPIDDMVTRLGNMWIR
jgi:hypothetical protein